MVDTRLDRIVAVKVCQERFSDRFEHEARAIAAFNHPNICQLYDVGPDYLVMEHVEGKPIAGPIAPSEFQRLARQIAAALDAAHAKGFVHRDLKPDNILLTKSGEIKLLDFGLAKPAVRTDAARPEENLTQALSEEGIIAGTLQYMSPEQLQGIDVDSRSDIFAFGAVLYEMLTGRRAFDANDRASIVAAILTAEPQLAPRPFDLVISRCLAKDPEARWQSARDIAAAIDCLSDVTAAPAPVHANRTSWPTYWLAGIVAALGGVIGVFALHRSPPPELVRFKIADQAGQYSQPPIVSPDGTQVASISGDTRSNRLLVQRFSSFVPRRIEGAE